MDSRTTVRPFLAHFGQWMQPRQRQRQRPVAQTALGPRAELLYAQVVKSYRRRRIVGVKYRVVFGTLERVGAGACQHAAAEDQYRVYRKAEPDIRQRVAAVGRRVNTLCQGEDGIRQQLMVYHTYYNFCLPHSSLRQPLPVPEPTKAMAQPSQWRLCTPAMAAGLTDHVWSLREGVALSGAAVATAAAGLSNGDAR